MKPIHKKGDTVTIYAKPLTHDQPEGEAKLIRCLGVDKGIANFKYWDVEFITEPGILYPRWVYPS